MLYVPLAQQEGVVEPDTVADNFTGESMTGVHGQVDTNPVEAVQLFYIPVNLTIPFYAV
ncbi:hypothetical protein H6F89_08250 [Cyanobacteria bacterium FACHB-63]|nr:hypothetical protein [Cyanobacteria bacterium FACHB-63]